MPLVIASRARVIAALLFLAWAIALLAPSSPIVIGDGVEYVTMTEKLAHFEPTSMTVADARARGLTSIATRATDRWYEFVHFWLYSALAVPLHWMTRLLGVSPLAAFTTLNLIALASLLAILRARVAWPATLFLVAGPIWWWVDKPHTEVFTYTLLTAAFAWLPSRAHWSVIAIALASAQNPPIGLLMPLAVWQGWRTRSAPPRVWARCLAIACAIAALHPLYYGYRMARPTALVDTGDMRWPSLDLLGYVIWDPNVGLLFQNPWPLLVLLLGLLAWRSGDRGGDGRGVGDAGHEPMPGEPAGSERAWRGEWVIAAAAAALFLLSFAQTPNLNHGATPGMSRYALWLIPLTLPAWRRLDRPSSRALRVASVGVAVASVAWTLLWFRPSQPEGHLRPSAVALAMWTRLPGLHDPPPEIFAERLQRRENAQPPAATPGCEKVLLVEGRWPDACAAHASAPPSACLAPDALCYANRDGAGAGYAFVPTTRYGNGRPWSVWRMVMGRVGE